MQGSLCAARVVSKSLARTGRRPAPVGADHRAPAAPRRSRARPGAPAAGRRPFVRHRRDLDTALVCCAGLCARGPGARTVEEIYSLDQG